jgi:hypothetical protein
VEVAWFVELSRLKSSLSWIRITGFEFHCVNFAVNQRSSIIGNDGHWRPVISNYFMIQPLYKRGHKLVWVGFLGLILTRAARIAVGQGVVVYFSLITFFALFIYGNLLVLRAKGRSWLWIVWVFLPPVFGALVIFWLKDRTQVKESIPVDNSPA